MLGVQDPTSGSRTDLYEKHLFYINSSSEDCAGYQEKEKSKKRFTRSHFAVPNNKKRKTEIQYMQKGRRHNSNESADLNFFLQSMVQRMLSFVTVGERFHRRFHFLFLFFHYLKMGNGKYLFLPFNVRNESVQPIFHT